MGSFFSRNKKDHIKSPSELQEELEQINVKMAELEARDAALERARRQWVMFVLFLALLVNTFHSVRWYWIHYVSVDPLAPTDYSAMVTLAWPFLLCFFIVYLLRRGINAFYRFRITRVRRQRDDLKEAGKRELVDHLKAIDFEKTQRLLMQYKARFSDKPPAPQPVTPQRKPQQPQQPPRTAPPKPQTVAAAVTEPVAPVQPPFCTPQGRPQQQQQQQQQQRYPVVDQAPPSPYMPPVPRVAPRVLQQRQMAAVPPAGPESLINRTVAWLVGDGIEQGGVVLICRKCNSNQGLLPSGEIAEFICTDCGFLNTDSTTESTTGASSSAATSVSEAVEPERRRSPHPPEDVPPKTANGNELVNDHHDDDDDDDNNNE